MAGEKDPGDVGAKPSFLRRLFGGGQAPTVVRHPSSPAETAPAQDAESLGHSVAEPSQPEGEITAEVAPVEAPIVHDVAAGPPPSLDAVPAALAEAAEQDPEVEAEPVIEPAPRGWWSRLTQGLSRSSSSIKQGIVGVFTKRKLDAATLEELEDVLIRADLGLAMATRITEAVKATRYEKGIEPEEVQAILAREIEAVLVPVAKPLVIDPRQKPFVVLVVGVNGSGKTTTIGKLAAKLVAEGRKLTLGAGDTFRAAAIEQLRIWGERTGVPVVSRPQGSDAAGLAFDAVTEARANGSDVLLIDTAGRLQNRAELMDELGKVIRVIRKVDPGAPHAVLLVLDATVGQNALSQVEIFSKVAGVTGLVMTKLDGTARGGILVAVAERFKLPVHFIGVGEGVADLELFEASDFARAIAGLDDRTPS